MRAESLYAFQARPWTLYPWLASLLADHMTYESVSDKLLEPQVFPSAQPALQHQGDVQGSPVYPLSFLQTKPRTISMVECWPPFIVMSPEVMG